MKSILLAVAAMVIYSVTAVVIEQRLEKFSAAALVLLFTAPVVAISLVWLAADHGRSGAFPTGTALLVAIGLGVSYFFADYFYLGAFTVGGNALVIATIAILAPVLTAIVRHFWIGGWPNAYQVGGVVLAFGAVLLLGLGGGR